LHGRITLEIVYFGKREPDNALVLRFLPFLFGAEKLID